MELKRLIKLQNAVIRAHQKIKDVQESNSNQNKEIKNEFKKEIDGLNKTLEQLSKELNSFTKKEELDNQNEELGRLKRTLDELNDSLDKRISEIQLTPGKDGKDGLNGTPGKDGKPGKDGRDGKDGVNGKDGANGLSAYEIAVKQGFEGTEEEWINRITNSGGKSYTRQLTAINERINKLYEVPETIYATGADFGEYFEWYDGNPNNEDRIGYFVTLHEDTGKIKIANSEDDILGITTDSEAFIGNYKEDKKNNPKYAIVGLIGVVSVRECSNIKCSVGGYCMPNDLGLASGTDDLGYQVVKRVNKDYVQVMLNCGSDMIHRITDRLKDLPTGGTELTGGDNTAIEENKINVYTNTGYKVSDEDIQTQSIIDSGTTGTNKVVYMEDDEIIVIYDGTNKIRRSENGIDFEVVELPNTCKSMIYLVGTKRLLGLSNNGYLVYSDDKGKSWVQEEKFTLSGVSFLFSDESPTTFKTINTTSKEILTYTLDYRLNTRLTSSITPMFITMLNESQYIWCNNTGTFKYGAGSREGSFISLTNVNINILKNVNGKVIVGLKNSNKIYIAKTTGVTGNEWLAYSLKDTCTINDIIFNPNDETYYIFTNINTYYKTKDFVNYESIDKNSLRGIQGYFTLEGIQMTTSNHNELLLAPTRTKAENMLQQLKRDTNKDKWVGPGLERVGKEQIGIKCQFPLNIFGDGSLGIPTGTIGLPYLPADVIESIYVAKAEEKDLFDPYEVESWYWSDDAILVDDSYRVVKFIFNQAGSFYDQVTWETEYIVEQYEYGYLFYDKNMTIFKYVKLGNKSWMFN